MKRTFEIPKSKLYAETDYSQMLQSCRLAGFDLSYDELEPVSVCSGAVCFFDPYSPDSAGKPFLQAFPKAPARPFYLTVSTNTGVRIAYAGLRFSDNIPVIWKPALFEAHDIIKLNSDAKGAVSNLSNSGFLGFCDDVTRLEFILLLKNGLFENHPLDAIARFEGNTAVVLRTKNFGGGIAVFSSGFGDGEYPSYIGYDEEGSPLVIICDFLLLPAPAKKEKITGVEKFEFDIEIEQLYQNDPKLGIDENNVAKWSFVIGHADEIGEAALYRAYARRGYAYHSLRDYQSALSDYYTAMELADRLESGGNGKIREWTLYDNAGSIHKELGNIEEAKRLYEKGKTVGDSFYSGAFTALIDIYMGEKNYESAELTAAEMVQTRPDDPVSYMKSAEVCAAAGKYPQAIAHYDILIERFHWDEAVMEKTAVLALLERYSQALATLESYLDFNAPNEIYYHNKGFLNYKTGQITECYSYLLQAYEINPGFVPTLHLLNEIDGLLFDYESIIKWSTQVIAIRPDSEYGYSVRADAYSKLGAFADAALDYERLLSGISDDPVYVRRLLCAAFRDGERKRAVKYLKRYKRTDARVYAHCKGLAEAGKGNRIKAESLFSFAGLSGEDALCDRIDFYIRFQNETEARRLLELLSASDPFSENTILRKIQFSFRFGCAKDTETVLDEYFERRLPGLSLEERTLVAARIEKIVKILL